MVLVSRVLVAGPQPPSHHDGPTRDLSGCGGPMIELVEPWSPPVGLSSRVCVLFLQFLLNVSCYLWICLLVWVNFGSVGYWLCSTMIGTTMEFGHKFHWTLHLLGGENGAAYMQHLHQSRWARESMSMDNHLLLRHHLIMIEWSLNTFTFYLQVLGIGISILSLFNYCLYYLVILMLAGLLVCLFMSRGSHVPFGCGVLSAGSSMRVLCVCSFMCSVLSLVCILFD